MVQRANRRIRSSLKYIEKNDIQTENTKRALVGDYISPTARHTPTTTFSRTKVFESESAYKAYKRHVEQWGGKENVRTASGVDKAYYEAIIKALTTTAQEHGEGQIFTEDGRLPAEIAEEIKKLTLEQKVNWFETSDISEDLEYSEWGYEDYVEGVDREKFVDLTLGRINQLKEIFPN